MPDLTLAVSFRYSEAEYVRAMRTHYASIMHVWLDVSVLVGCFILGAYFWWREGFHWVSIVSLSVSAIFALMLVAAFVMIPPLVFRREPKSRDEYTLAFSQEGIHFHTAHIDSDLLWSLYSRVLENSSAYILYCGPRSFTVIPKRAFRDANQQRAFEDLLGQKISKVFEK